MLPRKKGHGSKNFGPPCFCSFGFGVNWCPSNLKNAPTGLISRSRSQFLGINMLFKDLMCTITIRKYCSKTHSKTWCSKKLVPRYVVTVMEMQLQRFIDSLSFHLSFSQFMFYTPAIHSLCCSFLIFSSRSPPSRH